MAISVNTLYNCFTKKIIKSTKKIDFIALQLLNCTTIKK